MSGTENPRLQERVAEPVEEVDSVHSHMHFLRQDKKYDTEKPYSLRFSLGVDLPQSNILREKHLLEFNSIRGKGDVTLETYGFECMPFSSTMCYDDFDEPAKITAVFLQELCRKLKQHLGAAHIIPIDFVLRRRHETFPISTGEDYDHDQPTAMAHIDFSPEEGERMLRTMYAKKAADVLQHDWQVINTWKPLRGPLNDWPLGLCDVRTVNHEAEAIRGDIVYSEWATENMQIHYSSNHRWYYLPDQTIDEVLIFKSADSNRSNLQATPHGSFYNPLASRNELPRESIDCRFFALYAPSEEFPDAVGRISSAQD